MANNLLYYGIGVEDNFNKKATISLFFGKSFLTIAFYTKKYKFLPRFYFYNAESFKYMQSIDMFKVFWFFGLIK